MAGRLAGVAKNRPAISTCTRFSIFISSGGYRPCTPQRVIKIQGTEHSTTHPKPVVEEHVVRVVEVPVRDRAVAAGVAQAAAADNAIA